MHCAVHSKCMVGRISCEVQSRSRCAIDHLRQVLLSQDVIVPSDVRLTTSLGQLWIFVLGREGGDCCEMPSLYFRCKNVVSDGVGRIFFPHPPLT